jgi:hypothetical protein
LRMIRRTTQQSRWQQAAEVRAANVVAPAQCA